MFPLVNHLVGLMSRSKGEQLEQDDARRVPVSAEDEYAVPRLIMYFEQLRQGVQALTGSALDVAGEISALGQEPVNEQTVLLELQQIGLLQRLFFEKAKALDDAEAESHCARVSLPTPGSSPQTSVGGSGAPLSAAAEYWRPAAEDVARICVHLYNVAAAKADAMTNAPAEPAHGSVPGVCQERCRGAGQGFGVVAVRRARGRLGFRPRCFARRSGALRDDDLQTGNEGDAGGVPVPAVPIAKLAQLRLGGPLPSSTLLCRPQQHRDDGLQSGSHRPSVLLHDHRMGRRGLAGNIEYISLGRTPPFSCDVGLDPLRASEGGDVSQSATISGGCVPVPVAPGGGSVTASAPAPREAPLPIQRPPPAPPALGAVTNLHGGVAAPAAPGGSSVTGRASALWTVQPPAKLPPPAPPAFGPTLALQKAAPPATKPPPPVLQTGALPATKPPPLVLQQQLQKAPPPVLGADPMAAAIFGDGAPLVGTEDVSVPSAIAPTTGSDGPLSLLPPAASPGLPPPSAPPTTLRYGTLHRLPECMWERAGVGVLTQTSAAWVRASTRWNMQSLHTEARSLLDKFCKFFDRARSVQSQSVSLVWPRPDANWMRWSNFETYVSTLDGSMNVIGRGIIGVCATMFEEEPDPNRQNQGRVDFVVYRIDNTFVRLHPGGSRRSSAKFKFGGWVF